MATAPEIVVRTVLLGLTPVTDLVGTRIYQLILPQGVTLPALVIQMVSEQTSHSHDGRDRVRRVRVQITAWSDSQVSGKDAYAEAESIIAAVDGDGDRSSPTGLDAYQGDVGSPAVHVSGVMALDRGVQFEPDELRLVGMRRDYQVVYYDAA